MTPLPRGTCPVCGKSVALRTNGALREHYVYKPQREQRPAETMGRVRVCEGSAGKPA